MHATHLPGAMVPNTVRRGPGPAPAVSGYLWTLIETYLEAQEMRRAAHARWHHIDT